jgi:hypothetical protein
MAAGLETGDGKRSFFFPGQLQMKGFCLMVRSPASDTGVCGGAAVAGFTGEVSWR